MRLASTLQKALWAARHDPEHQLRLLRDVYGSGHISAAGEVLLRQNPRMVIFSEQQLFALQRLLVLHADDRMAEDFTADEHIAFRLALLYIPGTILDVDAELGLEEGPDAVDDERWLRYFIGSGGLAGHASLRHELVRAHRMYVTIASSRAAKRHRNYCPLHDWLVKDYGVSFEELQAVGFGLYAGSNVLNPSGAPVAVTREYFAPTALSDRVDSAFGALAADRDWYRDEFGRSPEKPRRAAFEIHPFLRRPALLEHNGRLITLAPRAIESWLSANGAYYRFMDAARERGPGTFNQFLRFNGWLQERYVRHVVHVAYPNQEPRRRLAAAGVVLPEQPYAVWKQRMLTTDVVVDLKTELVFFEVTAKRVTAGSVIDADAEAVRRDLQAAIIDKMEQLGRVIRDVFARDAVLPGVDLEYVTSVWPVVVISDNLFHNPSLWAHVNREGGAFLEFGPEAGVPRVRPLVLLDVEDLERLMGIVADGHSLTAALERKTDPVWRERDFGIWQREDRGRFGPGESTFVGEELRRVFRRTVRVLGLRPDGASG
jgi:hypothetical protein